MGKPGEVIETEEILNNQRVQVEVQSVQPIVLFAGPDVSNDSWNDEHYRPRSAVEDVHIP